MQREKRGWSEEKRMVIWHSFATEISNKIFVFLLETLWDFVSPFSILNTLDTVLLFFSSSNTDLGVEIGSPNDSNDKHVSWVTPPHESSSSKESQPTSHQHNNTNNITLLSSLKIWMKTMSVNFKGPPSSHFLGCENLGCYKLPKLLNSFFP